MYSLGALDLETREEMQSGLARGIAQLLDPGDVVVLRDSDKLDPALLRLRQVADGQLPTRSGLGRLGSGLEGGVNRGMHLQVGPQVLGARSLCQQ